jgi:hypothetical protein
MDKLKSDSEISNGLKADRMQMMIDIDNDYRISSGAFLEAKERFERDILRVRKPMSLIEKSFHELQAAYERIQMVVDRNYEKIKIYNQEVRKYNDELRKTPQGLTMLMNYQRDIFQYRYIDEMRELHQKYNKTTGVEFDLNTDYGRDQKVVNLSGLYEVKKEDKIFKDQVVEFK